MCRGSHKHHGTAPKEQPETQQALLGKKNAELVLAAVGSDWERLCKPNICTLNKKLKAMSLMSLIMFALMTVSVKLCTCHLI